MFQLSQLRCFVAVATELHFGRAAVLVNMTQPPLTRQIQLLEHEVGVQLLERAGGTVRLTPAGATFLREAEDILRRAQAATLAARRAVRADAGSVTLGFIAASSFAILPRVLGAIRASLPDVHVVLREMQTVDQLEALAGDRIDLGIVRPFAPRSFAASTLLLQEPLVLAVPVGHALAQDADAVPLTVLQGQPFIEFCAEVELARDKFLQCCYTGLSIQDADAVGPDEVRNGIIYLDRGKWGNPCHIPYFDDALFRPVALTAKYAGRSAQLVPACPLVNRHLKLIARLVKLTRLNLTTKIGRKTFVTLKLFQGVPQRMVMMATGHTTEASFNHYVGVDVLKLLEQFRRYAPAA